MKIKQLVVLMGLAISISCQGQKGSLFQTEQNDTLAILTLIDSAYSFWNTNPQRGLQLADAALKKSISKGFKKGQATCYRTQAVCYWSLGSYAPALDASFKGIKIAEEIKDLDVRLNLENILALLFGDLGDLDQAIDTYKRYINLILELKKWDKLPGAYNNLGYYFSQKKMIDSGLYYYQKALKLSEGKKEVQDGQYIYLSLSEAYFNKKEYEKAFEYCEKALPIYKRLNESIGMLECHIMFGKLEAAKGNYLHAEKNLDTAYAMAKKGNFSYFYGTLLKLYSKIDSARGNYKEAFIKFSRATTLQDSLNNIQQKKAFDRMLMLYKTDQKEKENLLLKESNQRIQADATLKLYLLVGAILFSLLVIIGILIFFYKRAIYRKRVAEVRLQEVVNIEKIRIAKELHDNIGSQLSVISLDLTMLAKQNLISAPLYLQLNESIHSTIDELRDTIWAMNKEEIKTDQLMEKITNLCWRFKQSTDQFQFSIHENFSEKEIVLQPNQGLNIFRIVQEAINNAIRHSQGTQLEIIAASKSQYLFFEVKDNGKGFEKDSVQSNEHFGLTNMKNRAREIGAILTLNSHQIGTSVTLELPLPS